MTEKEMPETPCPENDKPDKIERRICAIEVLGHAKQIKIYSTVWLISSIVTAFIGIVAPRIAAGALIVISIVPAIRLTSANKLILELTRKYGV